MITKQLSIDGLNPSADRRIDFLIIGAAKCATTSFHHYLGSHPDIHMPFRQGINHETGFFLSPGDQEIKGLKNDQIRCGLDQILQGYTGQSLIGERSTDYSKHPYRSVDFTAMKAHNPDMRFIYFIGDPVQHLIKLYLHHLRNRPGQTEATLMSELEKRHDYYEQVYSFDRQFTLYLNHFSIQQFRVVDLDGKAKGTQTRLDELFGFLGVPPFSDPSLHIRYNQHPDRLTTSSPNIPDDLRNRLVSEYDRIRQKSIRAQVYLG